MDGMVDCKSQATKEHEIALSASTDALWEQRVATQNAEMKIQELLTECDTKRSKIEELICTRTVFESKLPDIWKNSSSMYSNDWMMYKDHIPAK
jgi:hypothetical protein